MKFNGYEITETTATVAPNAWIYIPQAGQGQIVERGFAVGFIPPNGFLRALYCVVLASRDRSEMNAPARVEGRACGVLFPTEAEAERKAQAMAC